MNLKIDAQVNVILDKNLDQPFTLFRPLIIAPNTAVKSAAPIIDQITGKGLPPTSIVQSSGSPSSVAIHVPRIAPIKPTPEDTRQPPKLCPLMLCPIPPQIDAISSNNKNPKNDMITEFQ